MLGRARRQSRLLGHWPVEHRMGNETFCSGYVGVGMELRRIYRKCLWFVPACAATLGEIPVHIYSAHIVSGTDNVQRNSATGPVIRARSVSLCVYVLILQLVQSGFSQQRCTP